jgi:hypothetical protein
MRIWGVAKGRTQRALVAGATALVVTLFVLSGASAATPAGPVGASVGASGGCHPAGSTGLTAKVVATKGEVIRDRFINANGCDVGIFVGPGANNVTIDHTVVTGANEHGIFAENVWHLVVKDSTLYGNSFHTIAKIAENKAIEVVGTAYARIVDNTVVSNGFGGIGIADNGALDPGAVRGAPSSAAVGNLVSGNLVANNTHDCGIVVAAYNAGVGARHNTVSGNTVLGNSPENLGGAVGQIVVATDGPSTSVTHTVISDNTIYGSLLPGIVLHANVPGDVIAYTYVTDNQLKDNGAYPPSFSSPNTPNLPGNYTGISIVAEAYGQAHAPVIKLTFVTGDTVSNDMWGVWLCQSVTTTISDLDVHHVTGKVKECPSGGS